MSQVNQYGEPIHEEQLFAHIGQLTCTEITDQDRNDAIALILQHLGLEIIATNATKHGNTELMLRKVAP
jgi:hypothetical protein